MTQKRGTTKRKTVKATQKKPSHSSSKTKSNKLSSRNNSKKSTAKKPSSKSSSIHKKKPVHTKRLSRAKKIKKAILNTPKEAEQEFFIPSPKHRGKYRIPLGIRFLIGYLIFLATLYVISFAYGITFPTTLIFGKLIVGTRAMIINFMLVSIIFLMIYGFWKRKAYTFDLAIGFYGFSALNATISLLMMETAEHPMFRNMLILSFISLIFMNTLIIWYILHERRYFYARTFRDTPLHHRDKVFLYTIITFWSIALLIGITLGMKLYNDTAALVDENIAELRGSYSYGFDLCNEKQDHEKDVCLLVIATARSVQQADNEELLETCRLIKSDFYRFTCIRSVSG